MADAIPHHDSLFGDGRLQLGGVTAIQAYDLGVLHAIMAVPQQIYYALWVLFLTGTLLSTVNARPLNHYTPIEGLKSLKMAHGAQ